MFLLDIPCIHFHNKQGFSFIEALSKTNEVNMFLLPEIRAIIDFHWNSKTVKNFLYFGLILPYVCELILFNLLVQLFAQIRKWKIWYSDRCGSHFACIIRLVFGDRTALDD